MKRLKIITSKIKDKKHISVKSITTEKTLDGAPSIKVSKTS